jgi:hypothetical protein
MSFVVCALQQCCYDEQKKEVEVGRARAVYREEKYMQGFCGNRCRREESWTVLK